MLSLCWDTTNTISAQFHKQNVRNNFYSKLLPNFPFEYISITNTIAYLWRGIIVLNGIFTRGSKIYGVFQCSQ